MGMRFAGIADDLTGAVELASYLVSAGVPARLLTAHAREADAADAPAVVFGLKIRVVAKARALRQVERALAILAPLAPRQVFYKYCATFDSTPRGNIGPVADLLSRATGSSFTGFCPAFPQVERTVYQGHLFYADMLISRSPKRFDPLTPMREPDLVRVLQAQTSVPVGLIRRRDYAGGAATVLARVEALRQDSIGYAICDATDEADLQVLAEASVDWPLMTGGSSVAVYYPPIWRRRGEIGPARELPLPVIGGPGVVLAGSCAERTEEQLQAFAAHRPLLRLQIADLMDGPAAVDRAVAWAASRLASGPVAIATTSPPESVAAAQAVHGRRRVAARVEDSLGRIARGLRERGVRRFVVAGGETSGAVVEHLRLRALQVGPFEAPGLAQAVSVGEGQVSLHLKSGKLGPREMFMDVLGGT